METNKIYAEPDHEKVYKTFEADVKQELDEGNQDFLKWIKDNGLEDKPNREKIRKLLEDYPVEILDEDKLEFIHWIKTNGYDKPNNLISCTPRKVSGSDLIDVNTCTLLSAEVLEEFDLKMVEEYFKPNVPIKLNYVQWQEVSVLLFTDSNMHQMFMVLACTLDVLLTLPFLNEKALAIIEYANHQPEDEAIGNDVIVLLAYLGCKEFLKRVQHIQIKPD
jgi:hypothetical protein